jgi:hypothetical protein
MNSRSQNSTSLSKRVFEEAWICLLGFYGRAFESQYGSIDGEQFRLWFAGLATNGVTDEMVAMAVQAVPAEHARKTSHAPNFADFLRLCTSAQQHDSMNEDRVFAEASAAARTWDMHRWSGAPVYHAAVAVGAWSLRQFPEKVTRPKFIEAYRKFVEQERAGEALPAPPQPSNGTERELANAVESPVRAKARRERLAALSRAILELPAEQQRIATEALKSGTVLSIDQILPVGVIVSAKGRALLLESCCKITNELQPSSVIEESMFAPTL